jgi:hypothetical protein
MLLNEPLRPGVFHLNFRQWLLGDQPLVHGQCQQAWNYEAFQRRHAGFLNEDGKRISVQRSPFGSLSSHEAIHNNVSARAATSRKPNGASTEGVAIAKSQFFHQDPLLYYEQTPGRKTRGKRS